MYIIYVNIKYKYDIKHIKKNLHDKFLLITNYLSNFIQI